MIHTTGFYFCFQWSFFFSLAKMIGGPDSSLNDKLSKGGASFNYNDKKYFKTFMLAISNFRLIGAHITSNSSL